MEVDDFASSIAPLGAWIPLLACVAIASALCAWAVSWMRNVKVRAALVLA